MFKKISHASYNHPNIAWLLLFVLNLVILSIAILYGLILKLSFAVDISGLMGIFVVCGILLAIFYPMKNARISLWRASYFKRKMIDGSMLTCSFILMLCFGNQIDTLVLTELNNQVTEYKYVPSVLDETNKIRSNFIQDKIQNLKVKTHELKEVVGELVDKQKGRKLNFHHWAWILLLAGVVFTLFPMIVAGSCSLSCNGMGTAAGILLIGGTALLITGTVLALRAILRSEKLAAKTKEK